MLKVRALSAVWVAVCMLLYGLAFAQDYPSKPIRLLVPFPPGADTDLTARVVGSWLDKRLKQPVIVENRPGAGQIIATDVMLKAPPDGHTLLFAAHSIGFVDAVIKATPFVPLRDIKTIAMVAGSGYAVIVNPELPVKNMQDLIGYVKANPGKLNWGDASPFPVAEFADLKAKQGLNWVNVPFPGGAAAFTAVLAGQVQAYNSSPTQALDSHRAGKVRIIAYSDLQRHPLIPEVPTLNEGPVPGFTARFWFGLFGQNALPREIVNRLNGEILEMLKDPDSLARFQKFGYQTYPLTPEQAQREFERVAKLNVEVYKSIGINPN
ncbi:MAG TPA: tripartite tricarboxylate transporter substrate binding protein [Burkholderiales bacterium]|nr:tripartite tricarboxylate transporter substrate binding protein [Burkholderiales bacterium]